MFRKLKSYLAAVQSFDGRLDDAAIALATELRNNVKRRRRAAGRRRKAERIRYRLSGFSVAEARARTSKRRRQSSGISIDGKADQSSVRVRASNQVQHFRRKQGETRDLMAIFRRHMSVGEKWRKARGL